MPGTDASRGGSRSARLFLLAWIGIAPASMLIAGGLPATLPGYVGLALLLVANAAVLALPALLPMARALRRAILLSTAAGAVFTLAYMLRYGGAPGPAVLVAIGQSSPRELRDVLPALLTNHVAAVATLALLALWIWTMPEPPVVRRGIRIGLVNLAIWTGNALFLAWAFWPPGYARFVPPGAEYAAFPGNLLLSGWNAWRHAPEEADERARAAFRFGAQAGDTRPLRIVLVIGESASAARWQLGGHARATNPRLAATEGLVYFSRARADATTTHDALPMILGRAADPGRALREKSVVAAFGEAGYSTAWISNQDRYRASLEADSEIYVNPDWTSDSGRYDADLLPELAARLRGGGDRQFIVIHTLGSHFPYRNRVPPGARHFGLAPGAGPLEDYDDSILATDRFLAELIAMLREVDAVPSALLYVSDHGQDLTRAASGDLSQGMPGESASLREIPLFVWLSPAYRQLRPEAEGLLATGAGCPASQHQVFPTLAWLGRLRVPSTAASLAGLQCAGKGGQGTGGG